MSHDCIILCADGDIKAAIEGLLSRPHALRMRPIQYEVRVHPQRDPGVRTRSREFLALYRRTHSYALAVLDREGCGGGDATASEIEDAIESSCHIDWPHRIRAISIDPEVESWVWSDSPRVDAALGWAGRTPGLREWMVSMGFVASRDSKPSRPKEVFEKALWQARQPRSSTIFRSLGESVSVARCNDRAFLRLRETLAAWFPAT